MKAFDAFEQLNIVMLQIPVECWELQAMKLERCFFWQTHTHTQNKLNSFEEI